MFREKVQSRTPVIAVHRKCVNIKRGFGPEQLAMKGVMTVAYTYTPSTNS
jgi:hypothetical protein